MSEEMERNNTSAFKAVIVLLLVISGVLGYLWYARGVALDEANTKLTQMEEDMKAMDEMMKPFMGENVTNDLMTDFQNMINDYDKIIKEGRPEDQAAMQEQQEKIKGLAQELETAKKNGKVSASLIAKLKRENETLRAIMRDYVRQIDELNTKNLQLTTDLDKTTSELTDTKVERDTYKQDAADKGDKLNKAAKLTTYGVKSTGLRMKLNDTPEPTTKARNCVQAQTSFTISENSVASSGGKTVYLQITDPNGRPLQGRSGGTTQTEAGSITYSAKRDIQYANKALDVTIFFDFNGEEPDPGVYKVKIYCDGALIGTDSFSLR